MATAPTVDDLNDLRDILRFAEEGQKRLIEAVIVHGSQRAAARALGEKNNGNISRAVKIVRARAERERRSGPVVNFDPPEIIDPDEPLDDLIARRVASFKRRREASASRTWPTFTLRENGPFGLAFVGDPHMDDNGCNWPVLERDLALLRDTAGLYGVGMGDYSNNWIGRLTQLYANQETTQSDAWRLAEWFFRQKKVGGQSVWFVLLKGNHDLWCEKKGGGDPLDWMCRGDALLEDWRCKFTVALKNGRQWRVDAAHNHKGHSQWNTLHGPQKAALMGEDADIYVSGDKHNWAIQQHEDQHRAGRVYWLARCRGYKFMDKYASQLGFGDQRYGSTITAVVDPRVEGPGAIQCFADMELAADYLSFLRKR